MAKPMARDVASFDPTNRFTSRATDYVRYRPRYPQAIVETLRTETGLLPHHVIADIGSGTGFSAEMFLQNGNPVFGVEPNAAMRAAGEALLSPYPHFTSMAGTAEATTLPDNSVDYVIAGQALHWFDLPRAHAEFARILRPPGWVALFWNTHRPDLSPFMDAYEALLHVASFDYAQVTREHVTEHDLGALFANGRFTCRTFPYAQRFDFDGLVGRTFSSSYAPPANDPRAAELKRALRDLFARFEQAGAVQYDYMTELYFGLIAAGPNAPD